VESTARSNAVAESFFATIKRELIDTRAWPTHAGLRTTIFDWIEGWCNTRRLHSSLGYLSPTDYEATIHHHVHPQAARAQLEGSRPRSMWCQARRKVLAGVADGAVGRDRRRRGVCRISRRWGLFGPV
jgi:Integrase core domain